MKKKNPDQEIQNLCQEIRQEINHWEDINQNGCNDPSWPDGCNMNLTRNHILYAKRRVAEICDEYRIPIPEEMYLPTPPEVNDYYRANLEPKSRIERIGNREKITTNRNKYEKGQLSLF